MCAHKLNSSHLARDFNILGSYKSVVILFLFISCFQSTFLFSINKMDEGRPTLHDLNFSHFETHSSFSDNKRPSPNIHDSMAIRTRTKTEIIKHFFSTDSVYHILLIVLLYTGHTMVWSHFGLDVNPDLSPWHGVYTAINTFLRMEVSGFGSICLFRCWYGTRNAVQVDSTWMRKEESGRINERSWIVLLSNFGLSIIFILVAYYGEHDDSHTTPQRHRRM